MTKGVSYVLFIKILTPLILSNSSCMCLKFVFWLLIFRPSEDKIDKRKLLEIARRNALNMMKTPAGPTDQTKVTITAGGKTVNELTGKLS